MNRKLLWGVLVIADYGLFGNPLARRFSFHHQGRPTAA